MKVKINYNGIEQIEMTAFAMVVQALDDFKVSAKCIFHEENDKPQDIAEDVTREALDKMSLPKINERLYGNVDIKKAIYVFLPHAIPTTSSYSMPMSPPKGIRVALMLDVKAEKEDETTVTIQMSQTSMRVKMLHNGKQVNKKGLLEEYIQPEGKMLRTVTIIVKYVYGECESRFVLKKIIAVCIPNGQLQERYNPDAKHTIWGPGKNAPTHGEELRIRVKLKKLMEITPWRVYEINTDWNKSVK